MAIHSEKTIELGDGIVKQLLKISAVCAVLGVLFVGLTYLLNDHIIDPLLCQSSRELPICADTYSAAGNIAAVLVGIIGTLALVFIKASRPLLVAVAAVAVLWGLADLTRGLGWSEAVIWSALLYVLCYNVFSWIARCDRLFLVLALSLIIVMAAKTIIAI